MRELPANRLDPRVKSVWRITDALGITAGAACAALAACGMVWLVAPRLVPAAAAVVGAVWAAALAVCLAAVVPLRYARWRYELSPDYLDVARGILWRRRVIIPFIRVQNTDTRQGPILRLFGLAEVTISTAAGQHVIPGLKAEEAAALRDRAAEFARLAREDV